MHVHLHTYIYAHTDKPLRNCIFTHQHTHIHKHTHIHTHAHIHTLTLGYFGRQGRATVGQTNKGGGQLETLEF